jgi:hypothetical protein
MSAVVYARQTTLGPDLAVATAGEEMLKSARPIREFEGTLPKDLRTRGPLWPRFGPRAPIADPREIIEEFSMNRCNRSIHWA